MPLRHGTALQFAIGNLMWLDHLARLSFNQHHMPENLNLGWFSVAIAEDEYIAQVATQKDTRVRIFTSLNGSGHCSRSSNILSARLGPIPCQDLIPREYFSLHLRFIPNSDSKIQKPLVMVGYSKSHPSFKIQNITDLQLQ